MSEPSTIRINKFIAERLGLSRREADDLVSSGSVLINNQPARIGAPVSGDDSVRVRGQLVDHDANYKYILFNKPAGYICSRRRQGDTPTIFEILPVEYQSLKPVGRLDKDSSGILLLTNDGDFAHQMTHPSFYKKKTYEVILDKPLEPLHRQMISDYGVSLEDGASKFEVERLDDANDSKWRVIMSEGRNRQIRRTFAALGYEVIGLHRTHFGKYSLEDIAPGKTVEVNTRADE